jgi:hypothetical protein
MVVNRSINLFLVALIGSLALTSFAKATILNFPSCDQVCSIVSGLDIPDPVTQNPNNGILMTWNERQNVVLQNNLSVDRVADTSASFIGGSAGNYYIKAGTIVTSHYLQWDPSSGTGTVNARIRLDSEIFAFITADQNLFDSDAALGLPGIDYNDFTLRGLESGDTTTFNAGGLGLEYVDVSWFAGSPGDWTRLIAAYSPIAAQAPEPGTLAIFGFGLAGLGLMRRRAALAKRIDASD